jgi:hypothetical protein
MKKKLHYLLIACALLFLSCASSRIENNRSSQIENTVYRIQNKNKGDFINSEFVTLSKYTSEYSLIDNADFIPKSIILRNPPLGYQWRTFFLDSEMNDLLGY